MNGSGVLDGVVHLVADVLEVAIGGDELLLRRMSRVVTSGAAVTAKRGMNLRHERFVLILLLMVVLNCIKVCYLEEDNGNERRRTSNECELRLKS